MLVLLQLLLLLLLLHWELVAQAACLLSVAPPVYRHLQWQGAGEGEVVRSTRMMPIRQ